MADHDEHYLIVTNSLPSSVYRIENMAMRENVYTMDEIDALLLKFANDLKSMIDNVIILSDTSSVPNPEETSLWMEIKDEETIGEFDDWYQNNNS